MKKAQKLMTPERHNKGKGKELENVCYQCGEEGIIDENHIFIKCKETKQHLENLQELIKEQSKKKTHSH
jgi:hypothetical protein